MGKWLPWGILKDFRRIRYLYAASFALASPASAQSLSDVAAQIAGLKQELAAQGRIIAAQARDIERQHQEIAHLQGHDGDKGLATSASPADGPADAVSTVQSLQNPAIASANSLPAGPVGGAPNLPAVAQQVSAVPEGAGVLTPVRHFVLEPSLEFANSSSNLLVYSGVELIPGIQVGQLEANNAAHDTLIAAATVRFGLTRNAEIEVRVPYVDRSDIVNVNEQGQTAVIQQNKLNANGLGDIEFGLRYQLNHPVGEHPIFIASVRAKSDTGKSPYDVSFDASGIAEGLATGSGFWAIQSGLSFLLPSDPVVIFGGASFLYQAPKTINRTAGGTLIGRVNPGDGVSGNLGFAFALNRRFSFSLGYEHTYLYGVKSEIGGNLITGDRLQVGSLLMGMSYRLTERQAFNFNLAMGVTKDAPDVSIVLRAPFYGN